MNIKEITLKNFRNYENETIKFQEGLNVIIGNNAMGKTNLLESIYCCAIGKSPKTTKYKELIKMGKTNAYIKIVLERKYRDHIIEFYVDNKENKRIKIDGVPLSKLKDLIGYMNIIFFSPEEIKMIKEGPDERRKFINISLSQQSKTYLTSLYKYNEILANRNKLLKENFKDENIKEMLVIWDSQLAKEGAYVIKKRYEFVNKLSIAAKEAHKNLTDSKEDLELEYESIVKDEPIEIMQEKIEKLLKDSVDKDINLQYTSVGPHRDDIAIVANKIDIRKFGSQGQQRTCALSLKLAEISLFEDEIKEKPILLLDDVLSELDATRRTKLMELSSELQTMITCTDFDMDLAHNEIRIQNGQQINKI
ncbi:MAG: DNA replication/repair protein RecF [Clostridiales bacterium]|nr:DNA replication/repair protein RecF [Clostridiales bacterium]